MKQANWKKWMKEKENSLPETTRLFLKDSTLESVEEHAVTFLVKGRKTTFRKMSDMAWSVPSTLFVPYGSLSSLFQGFNVLIKENQS